ncbi:ABC transporter ATP-binding protein [Spirochaetota bacterium]
MEKILEVKNLSTSFFTSQGEVQAVRKLSLSVAKGEALGVVGESGSGKSVSFMSLLGLLPNNGRVKSGIALFNGSDLLGLRGRELRAVRGRDISMVFQDPMSSLNPLKTVGKQVAEALEVHTKLSKPEIKNKTIEMLKLVKIPEAEKRYNSWPHEFSGGMRQRVMIAMALVCEPQLVIADEPTTALDVTIQAQILMLLRELKDELGSAVVFISHDLSVIANMCQRIVVMYGGMVMEEASTEAIFSYPSHPYTMGLLASIPDLEQKKDALLEPIPGSPPDMLAPPQGCPFAPRCTHAMTICLKELPPLAEAASGHSSRCWLWSEFAPTKGNVFKEGAVHVKG